MLAKGDKESIEEDEDELTPVVESPKQTELRDSSKQAEPEVGVGDVDNDAVAIEAVELIVSQEDITKDWAFCSFFAFSVCIYDEYASQRFFFGFLG